MHTKNRIEKRKRSKYLQYEHNLKKRYAVKENEKRLKKMEKSKWNPRVARDPSR
jgi:hypothetical protein